MTRRAVVAAATVLSLALSTFAVGVTVAPSASAGNDDREQFDKAPGSPSLNGMTAATDGTLWFAPGPGTAMQSVDMNGAFQVHSLAPTVSKPVRGSGTAQDATGRIWFVDYEGTTLISLNEAGAAPKQLFLAKSFATMDQMVRGPDGNLWITSTSKAIGRMNPSSGAFSSFLTPYELTDIAPGPGNSLTFGIGSHNLVGRITTDGAITTVAMPGRTQDVAVADDGTIWASDTTRDGTIYRLAPSGAITTFHVPDRPLITDLAVAPDGALWFSNYSGGAGQVKANGSVATYNAGAKTLFIALGGDGNMWAGANGSVTRYFTGVTPVNTTAPTITGPANTTGTALTTDKGAWRYLPSSFTLQWQRCSANDPASCGDIAKATDATYAITDADLGGWLRASVSAKNLNGASKPVGSALFQVAPKASAPAQPTSPSSPTTPAPVTGVGEMTIAPGITATLGGPSSVKRKAKRTYRVTFNAPQPRGAVKFSLVNSAGAEAFVITAGANVKGTKKIAFATKTARIPKAVPKGAYTLVAVYTPAASQAATYPVATITKPLTLR